MFTEFLGACIENALHTDSSLMASIADGIRQVFSQSQNEFTEEQLRDWAYNSHLAGADKDAAIEVYEQSIQHDRRLAW